jgi:hypothetical protein
MSKPYRIHVKIQFEKDPSYHFESFPICSDCLKKLKNESFSKIIKLIEECVRK